jgi:hypothetical protein
MTLKPWREIAVPHQDVLEGTFQQAEFAADMTAVHTGKATPEYQDGAAFFDLTRTTGITLGRDVAMATMVKEVDQTVALSSVADENSDQSSSHRTSSAKMMRYLKDVQRGLLSTDRVA